MSHLPASGRRFRFLLPSLLLFLAPAASADWLVGSDGERIETRGPWQIKRSLVVFKSANGSLSSLRLADVDLEASERATAEAKAEPSASAVPAPPPAKREPVLVLTTEDVGRAVEPAADGVEEETAEPETPEEIEPSRSAEAEPSRSAEAEPEPPRVEVISWRQAEGAEIAGLEIHGTLRNDSPSIVTGAGVRVSLYDHDGELIARREAFLDATSIAGRATIGFRALFPGVDVFAGEPVFEVRARELVLRVGEEDREPDQD